MRCHGEDERGSRFLLTASIQEIRARVHLQTGAGLADVIRKYYPKPVLCLCASFLFITEQKNLRTPEPFRWGFLCLKILSLFPQNTYFP